MRIFLTKWFRRYARREGLSATAFSEAIARAEGGSVDADLGGGLIKQRIARSGKGKSGGYRTVIAYRSGLRSVFLYGFAKSERENLTSQELADYRKLARIFFGLTEDDIEQDIIDGELTEIDHETQA